MDEEVRTRVRSQAGDRCGYCLAPQRLVLGWLEIEHIIPQAQGGSDEEDNLWLACRLCNNYKNAQAWTAANMTAGIRNPAKRARGGTIMSQTLTISDHLLARLEAAARRRGLSSVEQLLETWQANEEELARFHTLAERWKNETAHYSNIAKRALHPAYQEIIGMGERVVPLLLAELRREPDD